MDGRERVAEFGRELGKDPSLPTGASRRSSTPCGPSSRSSSTSR